MTTPTTDPKRQEAQGHNDRARVEVIHEAIAPVSGLVAKMNAADEAEERFWREHQSRHGRYNHSDKGKARNRRYEQRRYERLRAKDLCVRCRKEPAMAFRTTCIDCHDDRQMHEMYRVRVR